MPTRIPTSFSRHSKTFIPVANGTIVVSPMTGGDEFFVRAPGQRQQRVSSREVSGIVRQLVDMCGGPIPYLPGPNPDWFESASRIVNTLLETDYNFPDQGEQDKPEHWADDPEPDVDDPTSVLKQEVAKRSEPIKKLHIYGRRWYRRGAGGVYCKAYIYINDKLVHVTPEQYGYNDHYLTLATDWLRSEGYLEGLLALNEPIWYLRDKKIIPDFMYYVTDVKRERDL